MSPHLPAGGRDSTHPRVDTTIGADPPATAGDMSPLVTLYTKPGCHLCDDARAVLERLRVEMPFELRELDIESDEVLMRAYFERIPVVALDGEELFDYFVDEPLLRSRLHGVLD